MAQPFSLAGLLRLRRLQQDRAGAELSTARARAADVAARRRFAENSLANLLSPNGSAETLRWTAASRASSASTLADLDVLETEWAARMEEARVKHAAARADTIGLEKLEVRHDEAAATESLRQEQTALDEVSSRAWHETNTKKLS
jgi:flagellar FliJ protein